MREITGRQRGKVFTYERYLVLFPLLKRIRLVWVLSGEHLSVIKPGSGGHLSGWLVDIRYTWYRTEPAGVTTVLPIIPGAIKLL